MSVGIDRIAPTTSLGPVSLTVADLERSIAYYGSALGLEVLERSSGRASLGAGARELLVLVEEPGARPARGHTGLFHVALLLPDRPSLARWLAHAARERVQLAGLSDHYVSEAIYLRDPDEHGLELYADRPRERWEGEVRRMGTWPLDVDDLLSVLDDPAAEPFDGLPDGTAVGHVHLCVARIPETVTFYRDVLGFDLMQQLGDQAAFLSPAATTITSGPTRGRAGEPLPRRRDRRRFATQRSCCLRQPSATASWRASPSRVRNRKGTPTGRSSATRRGIFWFSPHRRTGGAG